MVWLPSHCFRYTDLTSHENALCNDSSRHVSCCRLIGYLKRVILFQEKKATETPKVLSKYLKTANVIDRVGPIQKFYTLFFKSCYYGRPCFNYLNSTMRIYGSGWFAWCEVWRSKSLMSRYWRRTCMIAKDFYALSYSHALLQPSCENNECRRWRVGGKIE